MKKLDPREFGLNDNASSPAEGARVGGRFYMGIFSGAKRKRKLALVSAIFILILFVLLIYVSFFQPLIRTQKQGAQSSPAIVFMPASAVQQSVVMKDQLFYTNQSGLFSYDITAGKTRQIAAINTSSSIFNGQRIGSSTIGFQVGGTGAYATSSIYTLDLALNMLSKKADIGGGSWFVDNLDFISPDEFVYTEINVDDTGIADHEPVLLFNNGTTTQIGYILNLPEYGSVVSHSPDGKHLAFANEIYSMTTGAWKPIGGKCVGVQSAWLNNNVVVMKGMSDGGLGELCYYDITSGKEVTIGLAEGSGFDVLGNTVIYEKTAQALPILFQVWQYDYATGVDRIIVPNASLYYEFNANDLAGVVYQPLVVAKSCGDPDCFSGVASGSMMMFNPVTGSSTALIPNPASDSYTILF